jgi:hypothetical protein
MSQESTYIESGLSLKPKRSFLSNLSEDIWAVIIGGLLIVIILAGVFFIRDIKFTTPIYQWSNVDELLSKVLTGNNVLLLFIIGIGFLILSSTAVSASGNSIRKYLGGFVIIFLLAIFSLIIAGNKSISYYGIEYVVFALLIGLSLSNLFDLPLWVKEAARSEFFIKTGLIILGTSILFTDIVKAGLPGILQSILVVAAVWFFALWLSRKLKVDENLE